MKPRVGWLTLLIALAAAPAAVQPRANVIASAAALGSPASDPGAWVSENAASRPGKVSELAAILERIRTGGLQPTVANRPNIILAIADDWSFPHAGIYGDRTVSTPNFDRIAREGTRFTHAFVAAPSCTPSRAALLSGQAAHRLEEGANLWSSLPRVHAVYPDLLEQAGYRVGYTGKGWGPGRFEEDLYIRNFRAERWPAGDPQQYFAVGPFGDIDGGPSKSVLLDRRADPAIVTYFHLATDKRPAEELYDVRKDPHQMRDLVGQAALRAVQQRLRAELDRWMRDTADPRATRDDDRWDRFPTTGSQ